MIGKKKFESEYPWILVALFATSPMLLSGYYAIAGIHHPIKSTTTTIPTRFLGSLSGIPRVLEIRLLFCCCYIRLLCTGTGTCTIPGIPAGIILTY